MTSLQNAHLMSAPVPAGILVLKVNSENTRKICEIGSKLTIKKQNGVIDVVLVSSLLTDFTNCFAVSIVDFEQVNADWVTKKISFKKDETVIHFTILLPC